MIDELGDLLELEGREYEYFIEFFVINEWFLNRVAMLELVDPLVEIDELRSVLLENNLHHILALPLFDLQLGL